jgi:hypothetical protein
VKLWLRRIFLWGVWYPVMVWFPVAILVILYVLLVGCASPNWQAWYRWDPVAAWQKGPRVTLARCNELRAAVERLRRTGHTVPSETECLPVGESPPK